MSNYTQDQKDTALKLYVTDGPTAAAESVGCSKGTVTKWAQAAGIETEVTSITQAATDAARAKHELAREALKRRLMEEIEYALDRIHQEHFDYRGKDAKKVFYDVAPSDALKAYVTAAAILIDKMRLEEGKVTGRTSTVSIDQAKNVIELEIARLEAEMAASDAE